MSPIIPIAAGVALLAAALMKKSPKGKAAADMKSETEVARVYREAMAPEMQDLAWMRQAQAFLVANGAPELAAGVAGRIASIQATQAAEASAKAEAEAARRNWEAANGGAPTAAQLEQVWAKVQEGTLGVPELTYAWTLFQVYGTPARAAATQAALDRLKAGPTAPASGTAPVVVVRDNQTGATTPVPVAPPAATPTPVSTPVAPPAMPAEPPRYTVQPVPDYVPAPAPTPAPAQPPAAPLPEPDPNGTIALVRSLIAVENTSGWRDALKPQITAWQRKMALTADGLLGPKSVQQMALEVGVLPRIRYWSKTGGTLAQQLTKFRDAIATIAANFDQQGRPEHAAALRISMMEETGQGYPKTPAPIPTTVRAAESTKVAAATAATMTEAERQRYMALAALAAQQGSTSGSSAATPAQVAAWEREQAALAAERLAAQQRIAERNADLSNY